MMGLCVCVAHYGDVVYVLLGDVVCVLLGDVYVLLGDIVQLLY